MKDAVSQLKAKLSDAVEQTQEFRGEQTVVVKNDRLRETLQLCKEQLGFDYLIDISSLDHEVEEPRFEVVYELYSMSSHQHLRVRARIAGEDPKAPTVSDLWPTANWHEREIWDMMGIRFINHPDLRRILMWEGYPHFPLRKEFPLAGKPTDVPEVAFTDVAPLAGGPFVTSPTTAGTIAREPRARG